MRCAFKFSGSLTVHAFIPFDVIGVAQVLNRTDGFPFDENDEQLFEVRFKKNYYHIRHYQIRYGIREKWGSRGGGVPNQNARVY